MAMARTAGLLLTGAAAAAAMLPGLAGQGVECAGGFLGSASKVGGAVVRGTTAVSQTHTAT